MLHIKIILIRILHLPKIVNPTTNMNIKMSWMVSESLFVSYLDIVSNFALFKKNFERWKKSEFCFFVKFYIFSMETLSMKLRHIIVRKSNKCPISVHVTIFQKITSCFNFVVTSRFLVSIRSSSSLVIFPHFQLYF